MPAAAHAVRAGSLAVALAVLGVAGAIGPVTPTSAATRARPYLLGDSVSAWAASTITRELGGSGLVLDAVACRGTVVSCLPPGERRRPASGLSTIQAKRGRLGQLVVIELGYNDQPGAAAIDRVLRELRSQGVRRVVWVNLSERRSSYRQTNQALSAATKRWSELRILDWRAASAGHPDWFVDGVHLTTSGKSAFARFLARGLAQVS